MNLKYVVCSVLVVVGVLLFLYGVNTYNVVMGWSGIVVGLGGLVGYVILKVREIMMRSGA